MKCMELPEGQDVNFSKIVKTWQINSLIGKLMLIVETMGLQEGQERSFKSLLKQEIWKEFNEGIYISKEVQEINFKKNEKDGYLNLTK